MVTTPLLTPLGKLRLACEIVVPRRRDPSDESLASFTRRRMGNETYERLIQPLISSIYTADPTKLSMQAAMPQFYAMESKHGSLTLGMRRLARTQRSARTKGAVRPVRLGPRGTRVVCRRPGGAVARGLPAFSLPRTAVAGRRDGWESSLTADRIRNPLSRHSRHAGTSDGRTVRAAGRRTGPRAGGH